MKKQLLYIFALMCAATPVVAQIGVHGGAGAMNKNNILTLNEYLRELEKDETPTEIVGTKFLDGNLKIARLIFPEGRSLPAAVRYDVVREQMQVQLEEGHFRILHPGVVVEIGGKPFKMMTYKGENKTLDLLGYFEILTPNPDSKKVVLLKKYRKEVQQGRPAAAMKQAKPTRYIDKDYLCIKFEDSKPVMVDKKTENFIKLFPEAHQDSVEQFMKDNKLKARNQQDLFSVINYYNTNF